MADIPQEVREAANAFFRDGRTGLSVKFSLGHDPAPLLDAMHTLFLAGKRAGAEEEKRHQDFVTATAYECGHKAGMERAAEIAEADDKLCDCHAHSESECACGAWWGSKQVSPLAIAQAIRSENDG